MNLINPWNSYRRIATQTASPGHLVLMLYDGAIRFLEQALGGFAKEDPAEFNLTIHTNLQRAQEIVRELNFSLNMTEGGQLADNLRGLYSYMDRRLDESNRKKEQDGIHEVKRRLTILRDAWSAMLSGQGSDGASADPQLAAA
ncbi:MAG: flagellar export chaperone FliS [Verrucomicrobia bacterium]|nr:flagellar export chaperone FliS [Verrucomicrobiota bacterium]